MLRRISISDSIIGILVESSILLLFLAQYITESTTMVLSVMGIVYVVSSALSNSIPLDEIPGPDEPQIHVELQ